MRGLPYRVTENDIAEVRSNYIKFLRGFELPNLSTIQILMMAEHFCSIL
jgi:hypothetical protein